MCSTWAPQCILVALPSLSQLSLYVLAEEQMTEEKLIMGDSFTTEDKRQRPLDTIIETQSLVAG